MKIELMAEIGAVLSFSAVKNNDKVGLLLFTDKVEKFIPPKKGRPHVLRVIRELLYYKPASRKTSINTALEYLGKVLKKRAVIFLISDFMDTDYENELRILSRKHDVICCPVSDPREMELIDAGLIEVQDPETGDLILLDTSSAYIRNEFKRSAENEQKRLMDMFRKLKVDTIFLSTARPFIDDVRKLFRQRQIRAGRG